MVYKRFLGAHGDLTKAIRACIKTDTSFKAQLEDIRKRTRADVFDLLIEVVQRLPRYPLLLEGTAEPWVFTGFLLRSLVELKKCTSTLDSSYKQIEEALKQLREINMALNEAQKLDQYRKQLFELERTISGFPPDLIKPHRRLMEKYDVIVYDDNIAKDYALFIFNDILLLAKYQMNKDNKSYAFVLWEKLENVRVLFINDDRSGLMLEIPGKTMVLTTEQRVEIVKVMREAIDQQSDRKQPCYSIRHVTNDNIDLIFQYAHNLPFTAPIGILITKDADLPSSIGSDLQVMVHLSQELGDRYGCRFVCV